MNCNLCNSPLTDKIYESGSTRSLTSLCTTYAGITEVYFCHGCGHVQSLEIDNIAGYYDHDYDILVTSEEEDQIYEVINGENIYRTEHQVETLLNKVTLPQDAKILDYGCAKSSTMNVLTTMGITFQPYLFDVSDRYIPFWKNFLSEEHWAIYSIPNEWDNQFNAVTSFFSLEHMAQPQNALREIHRVLIPSGILYGIIPNVFTNIADLIVVDHVNHFTPVSLDYMLRSQGFDVVEIDENAHKGALVFVAKKIPGHSIVAAMPTLSEINAAYKKICGISVYWKDANGKVSTYEQAITGKKQIAIYGAGFYGTFILTSLAQPEKIAYIIDQNPFLQGKELNGKPIVSPANLPETVDTVFVGLNPTHARKLMVEIAEFRNRDLTFFYL
ncbi:MAG: class I SAM-dependent methyltransferase [Gammaproteobacteria bacterium]|nr:class I SAM-dependent methyltransferase [Gammaproteobacteria bacterium]